MAKKKKKNKMLENLDKHFSEIYGERFGNEKITQENIGQADLDYSKLFGANKNLYRTIPSLISGLKPGATRMLYAWWELEGRPQNTRRETLNKIRWRKGSIISSNAMKYHPHSDAAMQDLLGHLGQPWNNNVMLIEPQGSYGNMRGDKQASGRYIEAKISEYTIDCFFDDFSNYPVPMKPSYTGDSEEPEYLPAKYPHVLFNPSFSGIGYGLSSNIPPFNVSEVLDATIKLIKNPASDIMLIPDIPTGCDIIDEGNFKEINKTGNSKITMRASSEIDYADNIIIIKSLPLNSSSSGVISKIIALRNKGLFSEIIEIKDYTKNGDVRIEIYLKKDAKPDKVLELLYKKKTGLKTTAPVNITVIDDYKEYEYGVKDLLLAWIDYRKDIVRSMLLNKLQSLTQKQQMNEILLRVSNEDNIETTIHIAKTSKSRKESIERYMKKFKINSLQAAQIADMKVYQFNKDSYEKFKEEKKSLKEEIKFVSDAVSNEDKLGEYIISQLEEGKKKYGSPRKSKVIKEKNKGLKDIPDIEYLVGISESGYIKKIRFDTNPSIGIIGKTNVPVTVLQINNREDVLIVDSNGYISRIPISSIPEMNFDDIGIELNKLFDVKGEVRAIMELPSLNILKEDSDNLFLLIVTKNGIAKKIKIHDFKKISNKKQCIVLNNNDEVAASSFCLNNGIKDVIVYTNKGNGIRLSLSDIPNYTLAAKGNKIISLGDDERVTGASLMNSNKKLLFLLTASGKGKVIQLKYFPVMNRRDSPINLIPLTNRETLIGISSVNKNDLVTIYKKNSESENIMISDIQPSTRVFKGDKIVKVNRGDLVTGYKVFNK